MLNQSLPLQNNAIKIVPKAQIEPVETVSEAMKIFFKISKSLMPDPRYYEKHFSQQELREMFFVWKVIASTYSAEELVLALKIALEEYAEYSHIAAKKNKTVYFNFYYLSKFFKVARDFKNVGWYSISDRDKFYENLFTDYDKVDLFN